MHWLVMYDICDKLRLSKTSKILEAYGLRIQQSVFELSASRETIEMIRKRVSLIIDDIDSIVYIPLCMSDYIGIIRYGRHLFDSGDEIDEKTIFL